MTALALALLLPALSGWWSTRRLATRADDAVRRAVISQGNSLRFVTAALLTTQTGVRYVSTPSARVLIEYRMYGEQAHDIARDLNRDIAGSADEAEAVALLDRHLSELESYLSRAHRHTDLGEPDSAQRYVDAAAPLQVAMLLDVSLLGAAEATRLSTATADLRDATTRQGSVFLGVLSISVLVAVLIARWLSRTVARPLTSLIVQARALAARQTTASTPLDDLPGEFRALAAAMNGASESLVQLAVAEAAASRNQRLALVGQLAAGVAHELNNPLHTILLTVGVLQEDITDPQQRYELDVIRAQAARAKETVRNLSGTAHTDVKAREIVPADSVVRRAADELTRLAAVHGAQLTVELPSFSLSRIAVNREALTRVLGILVTNAAQASERGGRIVLRAEEDADSCHYVVEDEGSGLTDAALARLFEPFFTTKPVGEGTGLGLSLAQGIVQSHEGVIKAENRGEGPGSGARFIVRIPFAAGDARWSPSPTELDITAVASLTPMDTAPREMPSASGRIETERATAVLRALVVDDEPSVRSVLCRVLTRAGWRVDEASDGAVALALIGAAEETTESYRLILSDLRMPVMSGIELHDAVAGRYPAALGCLFITSGDLTSPDVAEFTRRTTRPVMEKPVDLATLRRVADHARNGPRPHVAHDAE